LSSHRPGLIDASARLAEVVRQKALDERNEAIQRMSPATDCRRIGAFEFLILCTVHDSFDARAQLFNRRFIFKCRHSLSPIRASSRKEKRRSCLSGRTTLRDGRFGMEFRQLRWKHLDWRAGISEKAVGPHAFLHLRSPARLLHVGSIRVALPNRERCRRRRFHNALFSGQSR
jgi:hypothetical protein